MKRRTVRGLQTALACTALALSCASEEGNDFNRPVPGNGGGKGGTSAGGSSGGFAGTGTGGTSGASNTGGTGNTGSGGKNTGGTAPGGSSGSGAGGTNGGSGGSGVAGDCSALDGEGGSASEIEGSLHVELRMGNKDVNANNQPGGFVHVVNGTDGDVALPELKVRYYFVSEFDCETTLDYEPTVTDYRLQNPHVGASKSDVEVEVVAVADNGDGCDAYVEFRITAPESLAAGQRATFDFWSKPPNYDVENDQSNDPSYGACSKEVVPWQAVPLYQNDLLVWGEEPYSGGEGGAGGMGAGGDTGEGGAPAAGGQSG